MNYKLRAQKGINLDYPAWICILCGYSLGRRKEGIFIQHIDYCGWCMEFVECAEPRDFSYPKFTGVHKRGQSGGMVLPWQELKALKDARQFLLDITTHNTERVSDDVLNRAYRLLRHYPQEKDIEQNWHNKLE